jgi:glucose-6-phosphate dehydrogenase assembly protein OpcA
MTISTDELQHEGSFDLDAPQLEAALRDLWHEAAIATDGLPVARVRVLNLIVYTEDEDAAELADAVLTVLPEEHPCRGIIVRVDSNRHGPLRATISARCHVRPDGGRKVCSELIEVTAGSDMRGRLVDALTPLLVADLPVVLWWTGRPRPADPVFRHFGDDLVDRVVLDSAAFRDPATGLVALSRWREDPRYRATLTDLAWERLYSWRQIMAQAVDAPDVRARLNEISEVTLLQAGDGAPPGELLLAAGWLGACFGWRPVDSPAIGVVTLRSENRTVTMRFGPGGEQGVGNLHALRLHFADGGTTGVHFGHAPGLAVCTVDAGHGAAREQAVSLGERDPLSLVVGAIGRPGRDPVYRAALTCAAEIATLGATA